MTYYAGRNAVRCPYCEKLTAELIEPDSRDRECTACGFTGDCTQCGQPVEPEDAPDGQHCSPACAQRSADEVYGEQQRDDYE